MQSAWRLPDRGKAGGSAFNGPSGTGGRNHRKEGKFRADAGQGLSGSELYLPYPSVGATEQAILAAVLADGVTVIHGQQKNRRSANCASF